jgi:hypothetical protein
VANLRPGPKPAATLTEFSGVVMGTFRSGVEPLVVGELAGDPANGLARVEATGRGRVRLEADFRRVANSNAVQVRLDLTYDPTEVEPSNGRASATRGGFRGGPGLQEDRAIGPASGDMDTVHGVRVTDAAGKPFLASPVIVQQRPVRVPARNRGVVRDIGMVMVLRLTPTEDGQGPPKHITFSGTSMKPVEVPFALKGVPLAVGSSQPRSDK